MGLLHVDNESDPTWMVPLCGAWTAGERREDPNVDPDCLWVTEHEKLYIRAEEFGLEPCIICANHPSIHLLLLALTDLE